jgi:hypothetical protein
MAFRRDGLGTYRIDSNFVIRFSGWFELGPFAGHVRVMGLKILFDESYFW